MNGPSSPDQRRFFLLVGPGLLGVGIVALSLGLALYLLGERWRTEEALERTEEDLMLSDGERETDGSSPAGAPADSGEESVSSRR